MPVYAYIALESVLFAGPWLIRSCCGLKFSGGFESGRGRGCAYTMIQTVQRPGVCTAVYIILCTIKND